MCAAFVKCKTNLFFIAFRRLKKNCPICLSCHPFPSICKSPQERERAVLHMLTPSSVLLTLVSLFVPNMTNTHCAIDKCSNLLKAFSRCRAVGTCIRYHRKNFITSLMFKLLRPVIIQKSTKLSAIPIWKQAWFSCSCFPEGGSFFSDPKEKSDPFNKHISSHTCIPNLESTGASLICQIKSSCFGIKIENFFPINFSSSGFRCMKT